MANKEIIALFNQYLEEHSASKHYFSNKVLLPWGMDEVLETASGLSQVMLICSELEPSMIKNFKTVCPDSLVIVWGLKPPLDQTGVDVFVQAETGESIFKEIMSCVDKFQDLGLLAVKLCLKKIKKGIRCYF